MLTTIKSVFLAFGGLFRAYVTPIFLCQIFLFLKSFGGSDGNFGLMPERNPHKEHLDIFPNKN